MAPIGAPDAEEVAGIDKVKLVGHLIEEQLFGVERIHKGFHFRLDDADLDVQILGQHGGNCLGRFREVRAADPHL